MSTTDKQNIDVSAYKQSDNDCGSPEFQIASLTRHIKELTTHCQVNKKDKSAVRSLKAMVEKRKKLLKYLNGKSYNRFTKIVSELKIRYRTAQ
mgnify:CR=1 FL=1